MPGADPSGRVRPQNEAAIRILGGPITDLRDVLGPLGRHSPETHRDGPRETVESEFGFWQPEYEYQPDDGQGNGARPRRPA